MAETKKIKTALVSVFHKDGLDELLAKLNEEGVKFLSTGGTQKFIESLGYECDHISINPRWSCEDSSSKNIWRYLGPSRQ